MSQEEPPATETTGHNANEGATGSSTPPPSILHRIMALLRPLAIERFRIIDLADADQTVTGIKKDIEFRGFNLWILVFSIIICSIGLNVNSTAVVIGAMLISPLMGPIMGIGLGLGTNDASTFKTAMANLGIAVGISILTSALYFAFSPINEASSELLSRTQPTLLDVVVALFGGLAGILAGSRKEKSNVIPGVAIATALMPPLCTAGYGLANGEWNFLAGGFYLFLINTALIALSTWLVVRYLRFPILHYVEPALERRYKRLSALLFLALLGPSGYIFYNIVQESRENAALQLFVQSNMEIPGNTVDLEINRDVTPPELEVSIYGSMVTAEQEEQWKQQLAAAHPKFNLNLINNGINEADIEEIREQMAFMMSSFSDLTAKDRQIQQLNAELTLTSGRLRQLEAKLLPAGIGNELYTICPNATRVRWGRINEQGRSAQVPETFMAQLEVTLDAPFPRPQMEDSLRNVLTNWIQARLASNHRMEVSIQYETALP